jgi:hypothetical protein
MAVDTAIVHEMFFFIVVNVQPERLGLFETVVLVRLSLAQEVLMPQENERDRKHCMPAELGEHQKQGPAFDCLQCRCTLITQDWKSDMRLCLWAP